MIPETVSAAEPQSPDSPIFDPSQIRVSLLTADPGPEVFELYGHEAIRVTVPGVEDLVFNYGVFDFNSPGFISRFVRGETDYMVAAFSYDAFIEEYRMRGSRVTEQELDLTPEQKQKLLQLLWQNVQPDNRVYRYKYLSNNCATQILDKLDEATGGTIVYPTESNYATWRTQMQEFNDRYPWYQFGIDLALGAPLDRETDGRQEMFMPVVLQRTIVQAHFADGRPLVKSTTVAYEGRGDVRLSATPWYLTPIFVFCLVAACVVACVIMRKTKILKISGIVWMCICGLAGLVIWYLILVSVHEATSPNILGLWAGPQCFVAAWIMAMRDRRVWMKWYMRIYAAAIALVMLLALIGVQHINAAMWPILFTTILFSNLQKITWYSLECIQRLKQ